MKFLIHGLWPGNSNGPNVRDCDPKHTIDTNVNQVGYILIYNLYYYYYYYYYYYTWTWQKWFFIFVLFLSEMRISDFVLFTRNENLSNWKRRSEYKDCDTPFSNCEAGYVYLW